MPQTTIVLTIAIVLVYAIVKGTFPDVVLLVGSVYWGGLNIILLSGFVARGWHGIEGFGRIMRRSPEAAAEAGALA